jgi:hypothetical protein
LVTTPSDKRVIGWKRLAVNKNQQANLGKLQAFFAAARPASIRKPNLRLAT